MAGAGFSLEWSDDIRRDPAAIEAAGLRFDAFAIDEAGDSPGIKGEVVSYTVETRTRPDVQEAFLDSCGATAAAIA